MGDLFVNEYLKTNGNHEIINLNLVEEKVGSQTLTSNNASEFYNEDNSQKYIDLLKEVDKVVITVPKHNFKVATVFANFIDHIVVANKTFSYKLSIDGNPVGLLKNLKVQIIGTQGGQGKAEHVELLETVFSFMGSTISPSIVIDSLDTPDNYNKPAREILKKHFDKIKIAANKF